MDGFGGHSLLHDSTKRTVLKYKKGSYGQLDSVYVVPPSPIAATTRGYGWNTTTGTLTSVKINSGTITLGYNGDLLSTQRTQPGSVTQFFDRTSSHESYTWNYTPTAVNQALLRQANFDSLGRATIATRAAGQVLDRWVTGYQYDARGRLTFVGDTLYHYAAGTCTGPPIVDPDYGIKPCTAAGMTKTLQYVDTVGYDVVGNIVKNTGHGGTGAPTYDAANRLTAWPGLSSVTSDADGNLTSRTVSGGGATTTYFWSPDALLDSVKTSTGSFLRYDYNAFGLLVRKWITSAAPDRHFVWDQGHLAIELNGTLTQRVGEYAYLPGTDQPLALITGATAVSLVRVIYQDVQGSVVGLITSSGAVNRYQTNSDPWGISNTWSTALPDTMRLRWQGLFFDGGIANLYYARARWYAPNLKRFLSPDPLGVAAGVNYYTFAGNDPLNSGDPFGLDPCTIDEIKAGKGTIPMEGGEWGCRWITNLPQVIITPSGWPHGSSRDQGGALKFWGGGGTAALGGGITGGAGVWWTRDEGGIYFRIGWAWGGDVGLGGEFGRAASKAAFSGSATELCASVFVGPCGSTNASGNTYSVNVAKSWLFSLGVHAANTRTFVIPLYRGSVLDPYRDAAREALARMVPRWTGR